jgi:hypothetical protein
LEKEESTPVENARRSPPTREKNRSSYSFSSANYDMVWQEAHRLNLPMTGAVNVMLDELRQWRTGQRRFVERRKQPR